MQDCPPLRMIGDTMLYRYTVISCFSLVTSLTLSMADFSYSNALKFGPVSVVAVWLSHWTVDITRPTLERSH